MVSSNIKVITFTKYKMKMLYGVMSLFVYDAALSCQSSHQLVVAHFHFVTCDIPPWGGSGSGVI